MPYRSLSNLFFLLAFIGFGVSIYAYFYLSDAPGATIDEPDREFPALAVGNNEVRFRFHNPTGHAIRVVGYQFC
jgi:hypothetical protein